MKRLSSLILILTLIMTGCASFRQETGGTASEDVSPAATALWRRMETHNSDLITFKSTGRIRLQDADGIQHARVMMAGYKNRKLRLEILGPAGQPMASFAYDGKRIYLISHTENRYFSKKSSNASLQRLISLPIRVSELLDLMAGRIPTDLYVSAVRLDEAPAGAQILTLKRSGRGGRYDKIYIDGRQGTILKMESFDGEERLEYSAEFIKFKEIGLFQIPQELVFSNGLKGSLHLKVERYWPNAPVSEELFELSRPD